MGKREEKKLDILNYSEKVDMPIDMYRIVSTILNKVHNIENSIDILENKFTEKEIILVIVSALTGSIVALQIKWLLEGDPLIIIIKFGILILGLYYGTRTLIVAIRKLLSSFK